MAQNMTADQRERSSGTAVAVFSIFITLVAVIACAVVLMLTAKLPSPSAGVGSVTSGENPQENIPPSPGADLPVFSITDPLMPHTTEQTATLGSEVLSPYALLLNVDTGEILASKNADQTFDPASMTKIMTLLVACQRLTQGDLDRRTAYTKDIQNYVMTGGYTDASCHWTEDKYLGDRVSIRDLLYGIGVESAADCSMMVVCYLVGGTPAESEAQFVEWMNQEAERLGLKNTHFDNVIGYESEQNYSTASDMAVILSQALQCQLIREVLCAPARTVPTYYDKDGAEVSYNNHFYSTLFYNDEAHQGRFGAYQKQTGKEFSLSSAIFQGGKTGSLRFDKWYYSLASFAIDSSGKTYVLITGHVTGGGSVLLDAKHIYDTYIQ